MVWAGRDRAMAMQRLLPEGSGTEPSSALWRQWDGSQPEGGSHWFMEGAEEAEERTARSGMGRGWMEVEGERGRASHSREAPCPRLLPI